MYIRFEDWSRFKDNLVSKNIPNVGKIIKAYASKRDPREVLQNSNLFVVESDHSPFLPEQTFAYPEREIYTGKNLEKQMNELRLSNLGKETTRALFRFANREDISLCRFAMSIRHNGIWVFSHPFEDLHGITKATQKDRDSGIHVDIFHPTSLQRLKTLFDFEDNTKLVSIREGHVLRESLLSGIIEQPTRRLLER